MARAISDATFSQPEALHSISPNLKFMLDAAPLKWYFRGYRYRECFHTSQRGFAELEPRSKSICKLMKEKRKKYQSSPSLEISIIWGSPYLLPLAGGQGYISFRYY